MQQFYVQTDEALAIQVMQVAILSTNSGAVNKNVRASRYK